MIARAAKRALQENIVSEDEILYELGDDELLYILETKGKGEIRNLAKSLRERKLYKVFDGYSISRETAEVQETPVNRLDYFESKFNKDATNRIITENLLSDDCERMSGDILIYCPEKDMSLKEANMIVLWKGMPQPLKKIDDELVKSKVDNIIRSHEKLWLLKVLIHPDIHDKIKGGTFRPHLLEDCCKCRIEQDDLVGGKKLDAAVDNIVLEIFKKKEIPPLLMKEIRESTHKTARKAQSITRKEIETIVNNFRNKKNKNESDLSK